MGGAYCKLPNIHIILSGQTIGLCGVYDQENLSFFYIPDCFLKHAQPSFTEMLGILNPQYAFVPTNDELLVSLCMDRHTKIEMQAYFFILGSASVRPPEYPRELFTIASPDDEAEILDTEGVKENISLGKYYIMRKDGVFLGQGFFNKHTFIPGAASIGILMLPIKTNRSHFK